MFTMLGEKPGVLSRDFASSGRNPAATKNWDETFVEKLSAQACGSDFIRWSEMDCADCMLSVMLKNLRMRFTLKSGFPLEYLVLSSLAIPALFTRRWIPFCSLDSTSLTSLWISSFLLISPGKLNVSLELGQTDSHRITYAIISPGPVLYFSTTVSRASLRLPVM